MRALCKWHHGFRCKVLLIFCSRSLLDHSSVLIHSSYVNEVVFLQSEVFDEGHD